MIRTKTTTRIALTVMMLVGALAGTARAEEEFQTRLNIDDITCREALKMVADERAFTAIYFHGYISGTKNEKIFDADELAEATDKIADYCIDNPSEKLLKAFETIRK